MPLTDEQRAALLAEIADDPLGLGLRTTGHARTDEQRAALDTYVAAAQDIQERLTALRADMAPLVAAWRAEGGISELLPMLEDGESVGGVAKERITPAPLDGVAIAEA